MLQHDLKLLVQMQRMDSPMDIVGSTILTELTGVQWMFSRKTFAFASPPQARREHVQAVHNT